MTSRLGRYKAPQNFTETVSTTAELRGPRGNESVRVHEAWREPGILMARHGGKYFLVDEGLRSTLAGHVFAVELRAAISSETGIFIWPIRDKDETLQRAADTKIHMLLDAAAQTCVVLEAWFNETDVVNASEPDPRDHYRLVTRFAGEPTITCSPDAGFVLNCQGHRAVYYLELECGDGHRGTGPRQLAERKCPGYAELARHQVYERHFPAVGIDQFRVLLVARDERRRDAIRQAFAKQDATQFFALRFTSEGFS